MKQSKDFSKLLKLAKLARLKIENLSKIECGPNNLMGYCGVASKYIEILALNENITSVEIVSGIFKSYSRIIDMYHIRSGHSWVEFDGYIIDITATQFKNASTKVNRDFGKKVYVCRNTNPHYEKVNVGYDATEEISEWYEEPLEDIVSKAHYLVG